MTVNVSENGFDERWLKYLRDGDLEAAVEARLGTPITALDLYRLLEPLAAVLDDDSVAFEDLMWVLDRLTGFCLPEKSLQDGSIKTPKEDEELSLWQSVRPLNDEGLRALPRRKDQV